MEENKSQDWRETKRMKKNFRFRAAMLCAKTALFGLRILRRPASFLPGKIALKICPDFLERLERPKTIIAVTGTNGKTTISNLLTSALVMNGYQVTNNSYGSNMASGIASVLVDDSTFSGKPKKDIAVLEVDERSSRYIYPYLKPDYLVCSNIMRDSIRRNANTDFITWLISSALTDNTKLLLNGDDIICSSIGTGKSEKVFYGVECRDLEEDPDGIKDITYCSNCGAELQAEYFRYNHIGRVYCPACGFRSPELQYRVTKVNREKETVEIVQNGVPRVYHLVSDNIVNIYNMTAVVTVLDQIGLSYEQIASAMKFARIVSSRFNQEQYLGRIITMELAKSQNPVACSMAFSYLKKSEGDDKIVLVVIDDKHENTNESENISWMYDCDYSGLADPSVKRVVFGGPRAHDHLLRALTAGVSREKIAITDGVFDALRFVDTRESSHFFILYDLFLVTEAKKLQGLLEKKIEEESKNDD